MTTADHDETDSPEARLARALNRISPLAAEDLALLTPLHRSYWPRGSHVLRAGETAKQVSFVVSGALREYYVLPDGHERTRSFNLPGDFAGSMSDLLAASPSRTWVTAETQTTLISADWSVYRQLTENNPAWARFARRMAEELYLRKVEREYELLALDAAARYQRTLLRWPDLETLFTQRDIASYIGITPVHLSRLRGRSEQDPSGSR
ncbi:CRP-like cAMP-binding protein [Fluviicoccus keumensis]|uniref:CRP-like cAMP-binding protein n=1 Tax=Fluviicoccus keumensis TaxID=1435465 RepID=A0A4Q7Z4M4_9GAMM|nr:Crp/Fnr family transcriptional regulator [Fluviicoccus keumensis]RZU45342.1 CRP-like cAMP-binding protein [Fluviicoccus keumensis]